jgi:hypothetical protein
MPSPPQGSPEGCNPPTNDRFCPTNRLTRGEMAAFLRRALQLPSSDQDFFTDDDDSIFEGDINAIAAAGITRGCNPPANTRFCPDRQLTRGEMAALLRRALDFPSSSTDFFVDDNGSIFETDINAIAAADVTRGCNPPTNNRYCPDDPVTREQMAAFIRRALGLPFITLELPLGNGPGIVCAKSTIDCRVTYDVVAGRSYRISEGHFLVQPATITESSSFNSSGTRIDLSLNGSAQSVNSVPEFTENGFRYRIWTRNLTFSEGSHTLVISWRWDGDMIRRTIATVRAD